MSSNFRALLIPENLVVVYVVLLHFQQLNLAARYRRILRIQLVQYDICIVSRYLPVLTGPGTRVGQLENPLGQIGKGLLRPVVKNANIVLYSIYSTVNIRKWDMVVSY